MSEKKAAEDKIGALTRFVDENFRPASTWDILRSFLPLLFVLIAFAVVFGIIFSAWPYIPLTQAVTTLISMMAVLIAYYSFIMTSRKYVNKRLAHLEAKRLSTLTSLPDRNNETLCLLPPIVALKQENYHFIKLTTLYEANADLFKRDKLMEYFYLD